MEKKKEKKDKRNSSYTEVGEGERWDKGTNEEILRM